MADRRTSRYNQFISRLEALQHGDGPIYYEGKDIEKERINQRLRMAVERRGVEPPKGCRWTFVTTKAGIAVTVVRE